MNSSFKEFITIIKSAKDYFGDKYDGFEIHFIDNELLIIVKSFPFKLTQKILLNNFKGEKSIFIKKEDFEELLKCRSYYRPITFDFDDLNKTINAEVNSKQYTIKYTDAEKYVDPSKFNSILIKDVNFGSISSLLNNMTIKKDNDYIDTPINQTFMVSINNDTVKFVTNDIFNLRVNELSHTIEPTNCKSTLYLKSQYIKQMKSILVNLYSFSHDVYVFKTGIMFKAQDYNLMVIMDKTFDYYFENRDIPFKEVDVKAMEKSINSITKAFELEGLKINTSNAGNYTAYIKGNSMDFGKKTRGINWTDEPVVPFLPLYTFLKCNAIQILVNELRIYQDDKTLILNIAKDNLTMYMTKKQD